MDFEQLCNIARLRISRAIKDDPRTAREIIINFMLDDTRVTRRVADELGLVRLLDRLDMIVALQEQANHETGA